MNSAYQGIIQQGGVTGNTVYAYPGLILYAPLISNTYIVSNATLYTSGNTAVTFYDYGGLWQYSNTNIQIADITDYYDGTKGTIMIFVKTTEQNSGVFSLYKDEIAVVGLTIAGGVGYLAFNNNEWSGSTIENGSAHQVAITWNGTNVKIYYDASEVYNDTQDGTITGGSEYIISWGGIIFPGPEYYDGELKTFALWKTALSSTDISNLYTEYISE